MSDTTTHLGLPYLLAAQAQKHVTHNEALRLLDAMVQLSVLDRTRTTPPASPADGNRHLVASGATGLWAGWDLNIAFWVDGAWIRARATHRLAGLGRGPRGCSSSGPAAPGMRSASRAMCRTRSSAW